MESILYQGLDLSSSISEDDIAPSSMPWAKGDVYD
jgi:hypothetical protein